MQEEIHIFRELLKKRGMRRTPEREIIIEGNILANNDKSGIGMMCCDNTLEDFQGAIFDEPIVVTNNTIIGNDHGLTGGGNLVVLNNLFLDSTNIGLKNATSGAVVAHNLFFGNGTNWTNSDVDLPTTLTSDPLIDGAYVLAQSSPAVDAGTAHYEVGGLVLLDIPVENYFGIAPDLGARETIFAVPALSAAGSLILIGSFALYAGLVSRRRRGGESSRVMRRSRRDAVSPLDPRS